MCFDVKSRLRSAIKYARHRNDDPEFISQLEEELRRWETNAVTHYRVSGFDHPDLLSFTDKRPFEPVSLQWGLIPAWVKDRKSALTIRKQTLNARSETIFEKPSFRNAAKRNRCLVYVDASMNIITPTAGPIPFIFQ